MVTTLNNVGVSITFQQQIPYFTSGATVSNGTVVLIPQVNAVTVTSGLTITPRINGDESITLAGSAFIGDTNGFVTGPNGSSVPITINQFAPIQRIIRNGDTMVVGGLIRKRTSVSQNKVPLLGDLPLIGSLFSSRNVSVDDSELLVFITPSIIPERAPLAAIGGIGAGGQGGFGGGGGGLGNGPGAGGGINP
jgi:general secretion pathway protein D